MNIHHYLIRNSIKIITLLGLLYLIGGCARTVTEKDVILNIEMTIRFRSSINPSDYNYGVAFGTSTPQTPIPPPTDFFPTPGFNYDESNEILLANNGINYYYANYFNNWSDYLYLHDPNIGIQLIKSNGNGFASTTTSNALYLPEISYQNTQSIDSNTLTIQFPLDQLSIEPNPLYFRIFVTEKTKHSGQTFETGNLLDISQAENNFIQLSGQQEQYSNEEQNQTLNGSSDIIYWYIKIF